MKKEIQNWMDSAVYDLETAEYMFKTKRYIYTVFMCHLALEKLLKAKVQLLIGKTPPRTHDLEYLSVLAELSLEKDKEKFIAELGNLSVVTRYPDDFQRIKRNFSRTRTNGILQMTKETFTWIKKSSKL